MSTLGTAMALVSLNDLTIRFRGPALLDGVTCQIEEGDRIGLVGRNGAGKTTLLRLLDGNVVPDSGQIEWAPHRRAALLPQDVPKDLTGSVRDVVLDGLPPGWREEEAPWQYEQRVDEILSQMDLDADAPVSAMSSGWKRRVLLAQVLAANPSLLLLDEPTNHLDIESIQWLEEFLTKRWQGTLLVVTHDRVFLQRIASRILELDRGKLFDWTCDYATFLTRKQAAQEAAEKQRALFEKKLAKEETWIRQGIKARRTRNEGRVRALKQLRREKQQIRKDPGTMRMAIQSGQRSGNLVAEVNDISFSYPDNPIVTNFSTMILRSDRVGIMGPNGTGKTTLLRLLLGELQPDSGSVRLGTNLKVAYFDQLRDQLHDEQSVMDNVAEGYDTLNIDGRPTHVLGYLQNFLFTPDRSRMPVKFLSGGERNRVLLAKLFAKPANVIVLDEPTNDLDAETLDLLEEQLAQFDGTVLAVSHDRAFLNNVVTSTIVFDQGSVREYNGGYDDWLRQKRASNEHLNGGRAEPTKAVPGTATKAKTGRQDRLTFREKKELAELPQQIESLESQVNEVHQWMASPDFYQSQKEVIVETQQRLQQLEQQLQVAFERWESLDSKC